MAVDPDDIHAISAATVVMYRDVERRLVALIADYLRRGIDAPTWAEDRLAAVSALRRAAMAMLGQLELDTGPAIREHLAEAYRTGYGAALTATELGAAAAGVQAAAQVAGTLITRTAAVESLAAAAIRDIGERAQNVARHVVDIYRSVILKASATSIAGGFTRRQAAQAAFQTFVDRGVTSFTDVSGRQWRLSSYVEMALRTVTQRAAVQGQEDRQVSLGLDYMVVSDSPGECPLCRPWEHKILSISGSQRGPVKVRSVTTGRMVTIQVAGSVAEARAAGLQHPNCTHALRAYLPGATVIPKIETADPEHHKAKERQRAIERQIRRWKEREITALTPAAEAQARAKVRAWQQELRDHLADNPKLKRLRYREQIGAGNIPPAQPSPAVAANTPDPTDLPGGLPDPGVPGLVRAELDEAPDTLAVEIRLGQQLRQITGRTIPVNFGPGADVDTSREHAEGILRVAERFPDIDLTGIDYEDVDDNWWANARDTGEVRFNLAWARSDRRDEYLEAVQRSAIWTDTRPGFHPRGTDTPIAAAAHEVGHVLLYSGGDPARREVRTLVAETAAREGITAEELITRNLGRYSLKGTDEWVAEAISDVAMNGDNATGLSKGIVAIVERHYRRPLGSDRQAPQATQPEGDVPAAAAPWHLHVDGIEDLAEDVEQGPHVEVRPLTGGAAGATRLMAVGPDGRLVVRKASNSPNVIRQRMQADAEQASSMLARALGLRTPRVYRRDNGVVWMDYVDAPSVDMLRHATAGDPAARQALQARLDRIIDSDHGVVIGLFDLISEQNDRHLGNWLVTDRDQAVPIDHAYGFGPLWTGNPVQPPFVVMEEDALFKSTTRGPFARGFVDGVVDTHSTRWVDNPLTLADIAAVRAVLDRLEDDFTHLGVQAWLEHARAVLDAIEPYAKGRRNLIAGR